MLQYFSMASNLGYTGIATEWGSEGFPAGVLRQIWYARYIDWVVTTVSFTWRLTGLALF